MDHLALYFNERAERYADNAAQGFRSGEGWETITYREMRGQVQRLARALMELGVEAGERVGIFSPNRPEWTVADIAILTVGAVSVPVYATNTPEQLRYVLDDAAIRVLFVGNREQYEKAHALLADTTLEIIVSLPGAEGGGATTWASLLEAGAGDKRDGEIGERLAAVKADDLATLIYTSGTTGEPKGVMLTHANFFHQFHALEQEAKIGPEDRSVCFLPLSHVLERAWSYYVFLHGASTYYLEDPRGIKEALSEVKPTTMVSVPRLYEKIYSTVYNRLESASLVKKLLFRWAIHTGRRYEYASRQGRGAGPLLVWQHSLAERLVLSKIRGVVGGSKNFFIAGGAPLAAEIEEFFLSIGLLICEGYGLTETSPVISANVPREFKFGTVGKPITGVTVRISEEGEIQAKGPNVMLGYYNKPEATAEAFVDGWFRTGDVGEFDAEGFLKITDRIKDLIITSGGKNIAPQYIELTVGGDHYIEQIVAIGDRRPCITALVVPSFDALEEWAREDGITFETREQLVAAPEVVALYEQRIAARSSKLAPYERIKQFTLLSAEFTQEAGELTPTMKVKRKFINEKYAADIDGMY